MTTLRVEAWCAGAMGMHARAGMKTHACTHTHAVKKVKPLL